MNITESLLHWYSQNKRPLTWRDTRDPYKIWLSEVILQQTRVAQGTDYYHRFLIAFPDIYSLAAANEQDVLKLWQGLGYYSRARNMHFTAKEIVEKYNGIFPETAAGLKKLKGIGEYTASAIASICFNEPVAVLDGNVARVLSRLYAITTAVDSNAGRTQLTTLANTLMHTSHPGSFNQAMMELGALVCTPKNPACNTCPLAYGCEALKLNSAEKFPIKKPKKPPSVRYMYYVVISFFRNDTEFILLRKRTDNDIWKNMYDFPCIETQKLLETNEIIVKCEEQELFSGLPFVIKSVSEEYIHQLSHLKLLACFISVQMNEEPRLAKEIIAVDRSKLGEFPVPKLIDRFMLRMLSTMN